MYVSKKGFVLGVHRFQRRNFEKIGEMLIWTCAQGGPREVIREGEFTAAVHAWKKICTPLTSPNRLFGDQTVGYGSNKRAPFGDRSYSPNQRAGSRFLEMRD